MGLIKEILVEVAEDTIESVAIEATETVVVAASKVADGAGKAAKAVSTGASKAVAATSKAAKVASTATGKAIDTVFGDAENRHYKKEQRYLKKNKKNTHFFIQKSDSGDKVFLIYDINQEKAYTVKGLVVSKQIDFNLLDAEDNVVGSVHKKALSLRMPIFHEGNPADFIISYGDSLTAILKTRFSTKRENYEIAPFGWVIKGSVLKRDFTINNGDIVIAHVSKRKGYNVPTYIIDFDNPEVEVISLLIIIPLICCEWI